MENVSTIPSDVPSDLVSLINEVKAKGLWENFYDQMLQEKDYDFLRESLQDILALKQRHTILSKDHINIKMENVSNIPSDVPSDLVDLIKYVKAKGLWKEYHGQMLQNKIYDLLRNTLLEEKIYELKREIEEVERERARIKKEDDDFIKSVSLIQLLDSVKKLENDTASDPHVAALPHKPASIVRNPYVWWNNIPMDWDAPFILGNFSVQSKNSVQTFVFSIFNSVLKDINENIPAEHKMFLSESRRIMGTEIDIVLMQEKNRIPCAAFEIKKNGSNEFVQAIFEDGEGVRDDLRGKVQGEHLKQLRVIQLLGFEKVFGLISDGNHSMITSTHPFDQSDLPEPHNGRAGNAAAGVNTGDVIYCSGYTNVGENGETWARTAEMAKHFLLLAMNSVRTAIANGCMKKTSIIIGKRLPARTITRSGAEMLESAYTSLTFRVMPDLYRCLLQKKKQQVEHIYLFKYLGRTSGNNGDCCLATDHTENPAFCVVKFFEDRKSAEIQANSEMGMWNNIYGEKLGIRSEAVKLSSPDRSTKYDTCLLMPFLKPVEMDNRAALLEGDLTSDVAQCLQFFASTGFLHKDLAWRHVGYYGESVSKRELCLCDLANLKSLHNLTLEKRNLETSRWIEASIAKLWETINDDEE